MGLLSIGGNAFTENILRVEISGPTRPQLTIVDLPGLIHSHNKHQTENDVELVTNLVAKYMANPRSIILAMVSAKNDFPNQIVRNSIFHSWVQQLIPNQKPLKLYEYYTDLPPNVFLKLLIYRVYIESPVPCLLNLPPRLVQPAKITLKINTKSTATESTEPTIDATISWKFDATWIASVSVVQLVVFQTSQERRDIPTNRSRRLLERGISSPRTDHTCWYATYGANSNPTEVDISNSADFDHVIKRVSNWGAKEYGSTSVCEMIRLDLDYCLLIKSNQRSYKPNQI
ncbi:uncharacterized protein RAG0_03052 [Rhynchosporium agropyri]|uniref:Dynamin N-terminal domain-containing protein n=1 Tax=Rhynchosporium agropyri TaxID=914238 RepID=A0A1E1K339_9HELO|nr:uncharacterized protein RAG0_03052 [Rhynchosporium agropyri]